MTLRFIDGFEGYDKSDVSKYWNYGYINTYAYISNVGRNGGNCLNTDYSAGSTAKFERTLNFDTTGAYITIGFAFKLTYPNGVEEICQLIVPGWSDGATAVGVNSSFQLEFKRRSSTFLSAIYTHPEPLLVDTWYYIEMKSYIDSSSGRIIGRINEQQVCDWTGDNVPYSASNYITKFRIEVGAWEGIAIDDVYLLDDSGSVNNDFLGDVRVDAIHPSSAGNYSQLTPSAGNNYECVDETSFDDSDYVEGATDGNKDSYNYADVPTDLDDAGIFGIKLSNISKRTAGSDNIKIKGFLRTGSTDYEETTAQSLSEEFHISDVVWEVDPSDSNDWIKAKINACEFGVEVA